MNNPKISVIVPVYKAEHYLRRCLDSIVSQTHRNLEIILVDDGSPDSSGAICDEYAEKDSRFRVIHTENAGVCSARNTGLAAAAGDWIGWVDPDDWVEPDMFEYLLALAQKHSADVAQCAMDLEDASQSKTLFAPKTTLQGLFRESLSIFSNSVCNKLYRSETIRRLRFDGKYPIGEDMLFNVKVLLHTERFVFGPARKYHYLLRQDSASHATPSLEMLQSIRSTSLLAADLLQSKPEVQEHFQRELLRNNMDICSKIVQFPRPEFHLLKAEIRTELRRNAGRILTVRGLSPMERAKLFLIAWCWALYRPLLLKSKELRD